MKKTGWLISRYLLQNIFPYFFFTWMLLSVILFVQQANRYADIFFSVNIPKTLIWQLTFALVPQVIAFTAPMAVLVGTIIGVSKMNGDSELVTIRGAGVGNVAIAVPVVLLGLVLSGFAFWVNLQGVPLASQVVRSVALRSALVKLESPIEPGAFNAEIGGYTIYVRDGDVTAGTWKNLFIYYEDVTNNQMRLITATDGRLDSTIEGKKESAELVLQNAVVKTLPLDLASVAGTTPNSVEALGTFRLAINTRRSDLVARLAGGETGATEELGLADLARIGAGADSKEQREALILLQRRVLLSVTPLLFALLGTFLVLSFNRRGRGFGVVLALIALIGYYLVTLGTEQVARTGKVPVWIAGVIPALSGIAAVAWLAVRSSRLNRRISLNWSFISDFIGQRTNRAEKRPRTSQGNWFGRVSAGIRDLDVSVNWIAYYFLTLVFLISIYLIFTTFEMWKFAGVAPNGIELLFKYLFYLIPLVYLQLAPSAAMIATLATFVIKSRRNEVVTWTAAGQSVYRLLLPCFLLSLVIGTANWLIQEFVAPRTNQKQDTIRSQIRNKGILARREGKFWVANGNRIYSFEKATKMSGENREVTNLNLFEFTPDGTRIATVTRATGANWADGRIELQGGVRIEIQDHGVVLNRFAATDVADAENPFNNLNQKPSYLSSAETESQLKEAESVTEQRMLAVALHKKYSTPLFPLIIALFTAPFALSLSRKGKVVTVGYAIGLWLVFTGIASAAEQAGMSGSMPPALAVWAPLVVFAMIGLILFSRVRT